MNVFTLTLVLIFVFGEKVFPQTENSQNVFVVNQKIVDKIKKSDLWEPMELSENPFKGWTIKALRSISGLQPSNESFSSDAIIFKKEDRAQAYPSFNGTMPLNFDLRKKWPKCITPVRDQGNCGSGWAFPTGDVLAENRCIILIREDNISLNSSNKYFDILIY